MEILSAIVQLLGGLALFLYGIELLGDCLKNSSGAALKRVLEKVTGNVVMGVFTGALVTAVIQSSTATIVLTVALIGAGVLNLKQAVSIVMGANIGTTVTAQIIRLGFVRSVSSELIDMPTAYAMYPAVMASPIASFSMPRSGSRSTMQALRSVRQIWQTKYKMPERMTSFQFFFFNVLTFLVISKSYRPPEYAGNLCREAAALTGSCGTDIFTPLKGF